MGTARFVRKLDGYAGDARLYRVDPPMPIDNGEQTEYIVVSGVYVTFSGPETYIFPADDSGEVTDWGELDGSFRSSIDHDRALTNAGYVIALG